MATTHTLRTHLSVGTNGTVSAKATNYAEVGYVEDDGFQVTPQIKEREVWAPQAAGGKLVRMDVLQTGYSFDFSAKILQNSFLLWELLFGTAAIVGVGSYTPVGYTTTKKVWIKAMQYDQDNNLTNTVEFWARVKITGTPVFGGEGVSWVLEGQQMYSAVQTGTLAYMS